MNSQKKMELNTESSNIDGLQKKTNKEDYLIKYENVIDTPFTIVSKDEGHFGVMGKHQITLPYEDKGKLRTDLKKITWNRLIQVIMILKEEQNG